MLYIAQVIIYTALMCLVYILLLRNRPMHGFNRAYLLATAILPIALPFITLPEQAGLALNNVYNTSIRLPEVVIDAGGERLSTFTDFSLLIYVSISLIVLSIIVTRHYRLQREIRRSEQEQHDGYVLLKNSGFGPASWLKYIFLPETDADSLAISHELAHIRQRHSYDIILMQLVQVILWPNLLLILIRKELRQVHEFQADAAVEHTDGRYAELLVSSLFNTCTLPYTHPLIIHPIKRRINMLSKKPRFASVLSGAVAIAATVLIAGGIVGIQSCQSKKWEVKQQQYTADIGDACRNTKPMRSWKEALMTMTTDSLPFSVSGTVDKMPAFPNDGLTQYLIDNIKYPAEAKAKSIEGEVVMLFWVEADGSVSNVHTGPGYAKVDGKEKGPIAHPLLAAEAERVVKAMPKWIPGERDGKKAACMYLLPIKFKLG